MVLELCGIGARAASAEDQHGAQAHSSKDDGAEQD
jgi:hypothetical protein